MTETNRQILLARIPQGKLTVDDFKLVEGARPSPGEGEALVRTLYISLDAANRAWMQGATYRSALTSGQVMSGGAIAEVVESRDPALKPGDLVTGDIGWQDYASLPGPRLQKLPKMDPVTHLMSVFGVAGLTAYFGLLECGRPRSGETVVVSAAAGSVGSLVGQIAKIKGCRVVGIAGGKAKCDWLKSELGFDEALDYKSGELKRLMRETLTNGIDVYFDNVGGDIFEACLFAMNPHGRIACCGAVSQYDGAPPQHGPRGVPGLIVTKRLTLRGFIVSDFDDRREDALRDLQTWVAEGKLKVQEDILEGLESTPSALIGLLQGENRGKRMVKVR